jgi:hypothetical protein
MKKMGLVLLVSVIGSGCSQVKLEMSEPMADPAKVGAGAQSLISVKVADSEGVVASVTATVREAPDIIVDLNDKGEKGDKVAGDGVWSSAFDVPGGAPAGEYHWDFAALDAEGKAVTVTTEEAGEKPLAAEAPVEVE